MSAASDTGTGETEVRVLEDWMSGPAVVPVMAALGDGGVDIRFVGGCVRDALLGRPVSDIDIGVPLPPDEAVRRLEAAGLRVVPTGIAHGTVTAVSAGTGFEVTSLRRDVETDGRRAAVAFTTDWREDALRRDFTMNALSLRPDGTVFDYFGGLADLDARCIRFVGDPAERIREDYSAHPAFLPVCCKLRDRCGRSGKPGGLFGAGRPDRNAVPRAGRAGIPQDAHGAVRLRGGGSHGVGRHSGGDSGNCLEACSVSGA